MNFYPLKAESLNQAKVSYVTHGVDFGKVATLINGDVNPQAGDLVLARVDKIGQHTRIELATGRKAQLFPGDEIIVSYGNRYAPDQFEAMIPNNLSSCHLVAAGGLASKVFLKHAKVKMATAITPLGLLGDAHGQPINLADSALSPTNYIGQFPPTIAVVGESMNAGKTTTVAHLIKGLRTAGLRVGAAKITGTGAGGDIWLMKDAGANVVLDFTDLGFPSTYCVSPHEIERICVTLTNHLAAQRVDVTILEIADGIYQNETNSLLSSPVFRKGVQGVLFAASSALSATVGVQWLQQHHLSVLGISGVITMSPLAMNEAAQATGLSIFNLQQLETEALKLFSKINHRGDLVASSVVS